MQTARDALDRAVQQLFARPTRQRPERAATPGHNRLHLAASRSTLPAAHPLCECLALQPLATDWQYLQRFPVLKRYVLAQWRARCAQFDRGQRRRQHLQHDALATPATSLSAAYARRRAIVVHSVQALCVQLYQCGVLHGREVEFVQLLVAETLDHGLGDALLLRVRRSSRDDPSALPLRVRMLLLNAVLTHLARSLNAELSSAQLNTTSAATARQLIHDVCTSLHEEVLEAIAKPRATESSSSSASAIRFDTATPHAKSQSRSPSSLPTTVPIAAVCSFCCSDARYSVGTPVRNAPAGRAAAAATTPWPELQTLIATIRTMLNAVSSSGDSSSGLDSVARALVALRNLLLRADVVLRLANPRTDAAPSALWTSLSATTAARDWRVSVATIEQIGFGVLAAARVTTAPSDCAQLALWERVWTRVRQCSRAAQATDVRVCDVVVHCAMADSVMRDAVVTAGACSHSGRSSRQSIGFDVVCRVLRAAHIDRFRALVLLEHAVRSAAAATRHAASSSSLHVVATARASSVAAVCRNYASQLLQRLERGRLDLSPPSVAIATHGEHLAELLHAVHTLFAHAPLCLDATAQQRQRLRSSQYCEWDRVLALYAIAHARQHDSVDAATAHHSLGRYALDALAQCCRTVEHAATAASASSMLRSFQLALARYAMDKVEAVVATNGQSIALPDYGTNDNRVSDRVGMELHVAQQLVVDTADSDRVAVRDTVCAIARTYALPWRSDLVVRVLERRLQIAQRRAWREATAYALAHGIERFLFPMLVSAIETARNAASTQSDSDAFAELLLCVIERLRTARGADVAATSLLGLCADWDASPSLRLSLRQSSRHHRHLDVRAWAHASFARLDMLTDVLRVYERDSTLASERDAVLTFLRDALERMTNCAPALESRLFRLLTAIKHRLEHPHGAESRSSTLSEPPSSTLSEELVGLATDGPATHADASVMQFMQQLHTRSIDSVRAAVDQLRRDAPTVRALVQHVKRWIALAETRDPRAAAIGKETKLRFAVLCCRLLCWLPAESVVAVRDAATPVSHDLVELLAAFATSHAPSDVVTADAHFDTAADASGSSPTLSATSSSVVRVELAVRSFVLASAVPDLCELTDIVVHAVIASTSVRTRDALLQMTQRLARALLVEVALETLRLSLRTECLAYLDIHGRTSSEHDNDDDCDDDDDRDVSVNHLSNALSIVGLSRTLFGGTGIAWSASLFDNDALRPWFLCFFDCLVRAEHSRALTPVDELLSSLECVLATTATNATATAHSYYVAALLCTAAFPQSRLARVHWSDLDASLLDIAERLLAGLAPPALSTVQTDDSDSIDADASRSSKINDDLAADSGVLVVWLDPFDAALARVAESTLEVTPRVLLAACTAAQPDALVARLRNDSVGDRNSRSVSYRLFARFAVWLASATIYSQSIAAATDNSASVAWEQLFIDYVVYLYLPAEFAGRTDLLLATWLGAWLRMGVDAAREASSLLESHLLVLPFQQKLFARLAAHRLRVSASAAASANAALQPSPSVSTLLFTALSEVLAQIAHAPDAADAAIVVLDDAVAKFDLVSVCTQVGRGADVSMTHLREQFVVACTDERLDTLSALQVVHLLKYPLELLACCFISACDDVDDIDGAAVAGRRWLEHVLAALKTTVEAALDRVGGSDALDDSDGSVDSEDVGDDDDDSDSGGDESRSDGNARRQRRAVERRAELMAFSREWTHAMQLKYAYVDTMRCDAFTRAVAAALT